MEKRNNNETPKKMSRGEKKRKLREVREKIKKEREEEAQKLKEEGADKIKTRNEKGQFTGSRLEVTPNQVEKARKEMEDSLRPIKEEIENAKNKIEKLEEEYIQKGYPDEIEERILRLEENIKNKEKQKRIDNIRERKKGLIQDLEKLEEEADPKGMRLRSNEEIEKEAERKKEEIRKIEKERRDLLNELENESEKKNSKAGKKTKLKTAREITLEDLDNMGEEDQEEESSEKKEEEEEKKKGKESSEKKEEERDAEDREENQEKETPEKKIKNLAQKIVNEENPEFTDEERQLQENYSEELEKELKNLTEEEVGEDDPNSEEQQEAIPENLAQFLEKETFGEDNKSILKGKWGRRVRHLAAGVGGAKALKAIIEKVPGITVPSGACSIAGGFVGGAITGVGLKLGHFGVEKWKETQNHANFSEGLESELEGMPKEESAENIEFNMAKLNTNAEILDKRIEELKDEKDKIKQEEGFFWFLKEKGRDINATIKEHEKTLEKTEDQFRYLSVELKDKEDNLNVEELADKLMDMKVEQLKEKIEKGGPHANLLKAILISIEGTEEKIGSKTKQKAETMKAVEKSAVGLIAKLEQEGTTITKEILKSAAFAGVIGGIAGFVTGSEIFEDKLESIKELFDSGAPEAEIESEIDGITGLMQEEVMEVADEAAGLEISYAIESSDSVWSVTEEFLYDNIAEFESLTEAEKTYVIDHITTTIESNPDAFGLELAEGETIDNLLADKHNINFAPLLDGQLEEALRQAESLSTEEVANILENNEKIRAFLSDHPNVRIDGNTIQEILSETSEELTEEKITEELIIDGLKSESSTSAEQLANIENWLDQMKSGELSEASFDFMADTSEGGRRELWVEQLAKVEGTSYSEMEQVIEESYSEINSEGIVSAGGEIAGETNQISEKASWVESLEEKFQEIEAGDAGPEELESLLEEAPEDEIYGDSYFKNNMAEIYEEKLADLENVNAGEVISETSSETYKFEGNITRADRWQFFQSFTSEFGEDVLIESDVIELLEEGEITPEEFIDWIEDGAFDEQIDFGGEFPPKEVLSRQLEETIRLLDEASNQHVYLGTRRMIKTQIDRFILFGKQ